MTVTEYLAIKQLLQQNQRHILQNQQLLNDIRHRQSWWFDFGANVAGNAAYDVAIWLVRRLLK